MTALSAAQVKGVLAGFGDDIAGGVGTHTESGTQGTGYMALKALDADIAGANIPAVQNVFERVAGPETQAPANAPDLTIG